MLMIFNILLANITILLYFFFFLFCCFYQFFTISVKVENARLKLAIVIPTGFLITVSNNAIEMPPDITDKKHLMTYQNSEKKQCIY